MIESNAERRGKKKGEASGNERQARWMGISLYSGDITVGTQFAFANFHFVSFPPEDTLDAAGRRRLR